METLTMDEPARLVLQAKESSWRAGADVELRFPWFLLIYLAAITVIGKGPTYLGIPPLYWGELVLALGLVRIAPWLRGTAYLQRAGALTTLVLAFMTLGAVLAAFGVERWRLDAIRDSAIWYYGCFFFIGLALTTREAIADRFWFLIRVAWILSLIWNTSDLLSHQRLSHAGPIIPWRGVPVLFNSVHEAGQNLALGALIVLCTGTLHNRPYIRYPLALVSFGGLAVFAVSEGRGMRLGFAAAIIAMVLLSFGSRRRPYFNERLLTLLIGAAPAIALVGLLYSGQVLRMSHLDRFAGADPLNPDGTANWRLIWWGRLYDHVMETNPVFGIGFGESLHIYNPLLESVEEEFVVRSPHNFNVTVFTRMGFLGLSLWAGILIVGIGRLCRCVLRGTARGQPYAEQRRDELAFWVAMLVCTVVNSSFGVLMEGPVLGIWFWFALGFATGRSLTTGRSSQVARQYLARVILRYKLAEHLSAATV